MDEHEATLTHDPWLSRLLRRDAYNLHVPDATIRVPVEITRSTQATFVTAKVPTQKVIVCQDLEQQGFRLVDTNVAFGKSVSTEAWSQGNDRVLFRRGEPSDREAVVDIARRSFRYSRFHLDPDIPDEFANEIKAAWAENYFNGERGDEMVVAEEQGKISGFALLLARPESAFTIDLIAVDPNRQRRGAAAGMIHFAEKLFLERSPDAGSTRRVIVGTQLANQPSIALYEKLGFRMTSAQYVFHFHSPPEYQSK